MHVPRSGLIGPIGVLVETVHRLVLSHTREGMHEHIHYDIDWTKEGQHHRVISVDTKQRSTQRIAICESI